MFLCMRTTIDLPDDVLAEVRRRAADSGRTLKAVIADALRMAFSRKPGSGRPPHARLTTFGKGGLRPGVDLDDNAALLDVMDR